MYYNNNLLLPVKKFKGKWIMKTILIFSLPSSGKSTLVNKLTRKLDWDHLNANQVIDRYKDWCFSDKERLRQA